MTDHEHYADYCIRCEALSRIPDDYEQFLEIKQVFEVEMPDLHQQMLATPMLYAPDLSVLNRILYLENLMAL